jgi:ABC-2 type transport system permease protein
MWPRIRALLIKEFIQLFRDPKMRPIIFVMPVVQLLIFGYAATTDVRRVALAVQDLDNSVASRELVARFAASGYFEVVEHVADDARVGQMIDEGSAQAVLRVRHGFAGDLYAGRTAQVQIILDGSDSNTARIIMDYASRIVSSYSADVLVDRVARSTGGRQRQPFVLESRAWFNPSLESREYYVPGVIAILVMIATLMLTSMAVVREKEIGTMEQVIVTPIKPAELILGKSLPFVLIGYFDVALISVVGVLWFDVPIRGSLWLLAGATGVYLMTAIGVGLLISTICQTQQQALMTTFFFAFPMILLSGFMFPIANMPQVVQWLTYLDPLRYFLVIVRGLFLKGVGLEVLWPHVAVLAAMGVVTLWLAQRKFHKRQ